MKFDRKKSITSLPFVLTIQTDKTPSITVLLYVLFIAYGLVGIFDRFPWKADEPYSFDIVWNMLTNHQWLVPHVSADPFVEKPPLMFWIGAIFAKVLPFIPAHESSRLAVVLFVTITVVAFYFTSKSLYQEMDWDRPGHWLKPPTFTTYQTISIALLVATIGLSEHIHKFTVDVSLLAGTILALAALVNATAKPYVKINPIIPGVLFGLGMGITFLSKGLFIPAIMGVTFLCCFLTFPDFRQRIKLNFYLSAITIALPFIIVWPVALYRSSPALFYEWFWINNIGRYIGFTALGGNDKSYLEKTMSILINGAPTSLLLLSGLILSFYQKIPYRRKNAGTQLALWVRYPLSGYRIIVIFLIIGLLVLISSSSMRDLYILPFYPAMALLAAPFVPLLTKLNNIGSKILNTLFCLLLLAALITWGSLVITGHPGLLQVLWPHIETLMPIDFPLQPQWSILLLSIVLILLWLVIINKSNDYPLLISWSAGLTVTWCVTLLLLMPWINAGRSYQDLFLKVAPFINQPGCLATNGLGESELGMLHYVTGKAAIRIYEGHSGSGDGVNLNENAQNCPLLLVQDEYHSSKKHDPKWIPIWSGQRPADHNVFTLYQRHSP